MEEIIDTIFNYLMYPEFSGIFWVIKITFTIISGVLIGAIIVLFIKTSWFGARYGENMQELKTKKSVGARKSSMAWTSVLKRLDSGKETEFKLAVIEAENLFEMALKQKGYQGENMSERMRQIDETILPNIESIWRAHKIRNNIVHETDYSLDLDNAEMVVKAFKEGSDNLKIS